MKGWQLNPPRRRLQRMSTNQHERLAVETPEERCKQHESLVQTVLNITEVLYSAVRLMKQVQSDVMWLNKCR